ncbi:ATP-binding protein [Pelagibius sp. Alg239-R121]|uniref:ATP-binding protein n=1 Tax=Pelagibius sp. Alg239-R121 TaxID=2993448 RepID=UPI0024A743E9|nr:ATP-binding protein [Pelagibius sp. Alg239-R121]
MSAESIHAESDVPRNLVGEMRAALAQDCAELRARLSAFRAGETPLESPSVRRSGSALDALDDLFRLTPTERGILCLSAGAELDAQLSDEIKSAAGSPQPDVALAQALFGDTGWDALCPAAPLRRCRLLDLSGSGPFLRRKIEVDERLLNFLMGLNYLDTRLEGIVTRVRSSGAVLNPVDQNASAHRVLAAWSVPTAMPVLLLAGRDKLIARATLAAATDALRLSLFRISESDIPTDWTQRHALAVYLDREMALSDGAILIESYETEGGQAGRLADMLAGPTAIAAIDPAVPERGPRLRIDIPEATVSERRAIWHETVGPQAEALGTGLDRLAEQFSLDRAGVFAAVEASLNGTAVDPDKVFGRLWQAAREQGRRQLDGLAERIESQADWDDLVLPEQQMALLGDLAMHVQESWRISEAWGWKQKSPRGLGAAALFSGPSGTGKTFAAEVLANRLGLDLYRIDLSQVVSKYIGETEKNLSRIFTAAEDGGAILLFDEADALFGKRSEVKDSHDRYANVEVSYLLQRMEAYRGLAVLTTNQKSALDSAFLRRLRYVIQFPFPDATARAEIWARIFPQATPVEGLDPQKLSRMNLSGGSIRSVALNASFLAAGANTPVMPQHVLNAARREYAKLEKPFSAAEIGGIT